MQNEYFKDLQEHDMLKSGVYVPTPPKHTQKLLLNFLLTNQIRGSGLWGLRDVISVGDSAPHSGVRHIDVSHK